MHRMARGLLAAAITAMTGCATQVPNTALTDIAPVVTPQPCTNPIAVVDATKLVNARFDTLGSVVKHRLSADLQVSAGSAARLLDAVLALLRGSVNRDAEPPSRAEAASNLTVDNIRMFAVGLHQTALALPAAPQPSPAETHQFNADIRQFDTILVSYVEAYIQGNYIDRFGNRLPAPKFSSTVGDTEIAGILSVLMDAVGDFLLRTPAWVDDRDHPSQFYAPYATGDAASGGHSPGQTPPTAAAIMTVDTDPAQRFFPRVALVNQPRGYGPACGIDAMKARAIAYLGQTAALKASAAGGLLAADVGGTGISFFLFQKISIGDSQTIRVMVETLLAKLAERIATEAAYRALLNVNDAQFSQLADLLLYMASHPASAPPASHTP